MTTWNDKPDVSSSYVDPAAPATAYTSPGDIWLERIVSPNFTLPQTAWVLSGDAAIEQDLFVSQPDALSLYQTHGSGPTIASGCQQDDISLDDGEDFHASLWFNPDFAFEQGGNYERLRIYMDYGDGAFRLLFQKRKSQVGAGWQLFEWDFTATGTAGRVLMNVIRTTTFPPAIGVGRWAIDNVSCKRGTIYTPAPEPTTVWS